MDISVVPTNYQDTFLAWGKRPGLTEDDLKIVDPDNGDLIIKCLKPNQRWASMYRVDSYAQAHSFIEYYVAWATSESNNGGEVGKQNCSP